LIVRSYTETAGQCNGKIKFVEIAEAVQLARLLAGLALDDVADFAGISPSELAGIEQRDLTPDFDVFDDVMTVTGYQMSSGALVPRCDLDAVRAARRLLEPELGLAATTGSQRIAATWRRRGFTDLDYIARRAGYAARVSVRPGARQFAWPSGSVLDPSAWPATFAWAIAGNPSPSSPGSIVLYVDDVDLAVIDLGPLDESRTVDSLTILPFDEVTRAGVWADESGGRWVSAGQVLIDNPRRPGTTLGGRRPRIAAARRI
jgi:transcriptional regulator with XRE-family HTH domain